jgi:O-succinylbenzoate synthase
MVKKLFRYKLALKNGKTREGLVLQVNHGFGEIAPLPGFSKETLEEAQKEALAWIHSGIDPALPSVRFGISSAQKSLRSVHLPLCALGPREGFSTVKLKLGHLPLRGAISLVKEHYRHVRLRLDCNRAWSLSEALEFASHFQPTDFVYMEEPLKTFEALADFSKMTRFPIALDESIERDWTQIPTLKAIVVKPTLVGSIPKIPPHLDLVLSSAYESGLGLLHIANLANNNLPIGLDTYNVFEEDLLQSPIDCSSGTFSWRSTIPLLDSSKLCAL